MQLVPVSGSAPPSFEGGTLVVPAVAFANIGELAIDALIATLQLPLAGRLDDPNCQAAVGNNAFVGTHPGTLATALEVYSSSDPEAATAAAAASTSGQASGPLVLLQQRAPAIPGRQAAFADALAKWAQGAGIARLVVVAGLDSRLRRAAQLEGPQLRWRLQGEWPGAAEVCEAAGARALEERVEAEERELHGLLPPWPLLEALAGAGLPVLLLTEFASEGDNTLDALRLGSAALKVLAALGAAPGAPPSGVSGNVSGLLAALGTEQGLAAAAAAAATLGLAVPPSWVGLYGRPLDRSLSGW